MRKINYELESLICLYESNIKAIEELENYYKTNPYDHIKERIIARLNNQKDLLKKINSFGFSKHYFDTFILNMKYAKYSGKLKEINQLTSKVINSRKVPKVTFKLATSFLVASLLISAPSSSNGECEDYSELSPELIEELVDINYLTRETVDVLLPTNIGSQRELASNVLEINNNIYYDINCPEELQDYFYELEEKWGIPANLAMLIVDQESDGHWNTNGVISRTNDYGLAQINKCNHRSIFNALGYTSNDLRNDQYKNLDAMFYLLSNIFNLYGYTKDNYDIENVCGTYNGYIYWRNNEFSCKYVDDCMERYNTIFVDNSNEEKLLMRDFF